MKTKIKVCSVISAFALLMCGTFKNKFSKKAGSHEPTFFLQNIMAEEFFCREILPLAFPSRHEIRL